MIFGHDLIRHRPYSRLCKSFLFHAQMYVWLQILETERFPQVCHRQTHRDFKYWVQGPSITQLRSRRL